MSCVHIDDVAGMALRAVETQLAKNRARMLSQVRRVREPIARFRRPLPAKGAHRHAAERIVLDPAHGVHCLHLRIVEHLRARDADGAMRAIRSNWERSLARLRTGVCAPAAGAAGDPTLAGLN